jgi:hypothetical protein
MNQAAGRPARIRTGSTASLMHASLVGVMFARFLGMVDRVGLTPLRDMRMMPSALVIPSFVVAACSAPSLDLVKPPMRYRKRGCRFHER